jgi:hydrogenase maturation protein HypF
MDFFRGLDMERRVRIRLTGIVQGVGMRPFVYNLANKWGLKGYCLNDPSGLTIEVEGVGVNGFIEELRKAAPPLSRVEGLSIEPSGEGGPFGGFTIRESAEDPGGSTLIAPDAAICEDCLRELLDPLDRRHLYPFINCTNCGPRYSIVREVPYDRKNTTMARFRLCPACEAEYLDPGDRRFHAQPNACASCGPSVWLAGRGAVSPLGPERNYAAISLARARLREGAILAIKGLGGFHLACDAGSDDAVERLRRLKRASGVAGGFSDKPFALMAPDVRAASAFAEVDGDGEAALRHRSAPIVLLPRRPGQALSRRIAPGNSRFGVMLPYTPMHRLLFGTGDPGERPFAALVMTSGNLSDEPIITSNEEAVQRLARIADGFLLHDREIHMRVDDSIVKTGAGRLRVMRRSRGHAPEPIDMGEEMDGILACGALLKNTFCITSGRSAVLSQHIGDLDDADSAAFFKETLDNLKYSFRVNPTIVAHDAHPDYQSTLIAREYASERGMAPEKVVAVWHHHAHVASCMAEHGITEKVIGVAFDGAGAGPDGTVWGGEFLLADRGSFERRAHLKSVALPGGDMAARQPWRMGVSFILDAYGHEEAEAVIRGLYGALDSRAVSTVVRMIRGAINSPLTSSAGRLFDAVASIAGLKDEVGFEAEAAMELESLADMGAVASTEAYPFDMAGGSPHVVDLSPLIRRAVEDRASGVPAPVISGRFHYAVGAVISRVCARVREDCGINRVVLTGGVFQNSILSGLAEDGLRRMGFEVFSHARVPANDGGVSLGQAAVAWEKVKRGGRAVI